MSNEQKVVQNITHPPKRGVDPPMCTPKKKYCAPPVVAASTSSQVQKPCSQINKIASQDAEMTDEDLLQYLDKDEASPSNVQNYNQENNKGGLIQKIMGR